MHGILPFFNTIEAHIPVHQSTPGNLCGISQGKQNHHSHHGLKRLINAYTTQETNSIGPQSSLSTFDLDLLTDSQEGGEGTPVCIILAK